MKKDAFEAFWAVSTCPRSESAEAALRAWVERAEGAHADLPVERDQFLAYLAGRMQPGDLLDQLERNEPGEILLAFACMIGNRIAMSRFERLYFGEIRVGASRMRCSSDELDEVTQSVRQVLFFDGRVGEMVARGDLRALIRLVALRAAMTLRRKQGTTPVPTDHVFELLDSTDTPFLLVAKEQHRELFAEALQHAVAALPARDRALLRLNQVDGVPLAKLASMHHVDPSTISRWLARARQQVLRHTHKRLAREHGIGRDHVDSFLDLIRSRFDASIARMLDNDGDPTLK